MAPEIIFKKVSYNYTKNTPALVGISCQIVPNSFTMVLGKNGSGKSTLIQQIDGLLRPTRGEVNVGDISVTPHIKTYDLKRLRKKIGFAFQNPQDQLFGETVADDLSFGPRNFGFSKSQIRSNVKTSAEQLRITPLLSYSPFDLSGGQMKRVAIAGALASQPEILILDEPTMGLDLVGENHIMKVINHLRLKYHLTVIMVTHQMNLVTKYATQVLVLDRGRLIANASPIRLFTNSRLLKRVGLLQPFVIRFVTQLKRKGLKFNHVPLTLSELADELYEMCKKRHFHE